MRVVLVFIVLIAVCAALVGIGYGMGKQAGGLHRSERKRLRTAESILDDLQNGAAEHVALGDAYAAIVMDTIREYKNRRELT